MLAAYSRPMTSVEVRPDEVVAVINELHAVAEIVRTYGDLGGSQRSALVATPTQLYFIAAAVETELRSWRYVDQLVATRHFRVAASQESTPAATIRVDVTSADCVVVGAVSPEVCVAELGEALQRLTAAMRRLRGAMRTGSTEELSKRLETEVERLRTFIAAFA